MPPNSIGLIFQDYVANEYDFPIAPEFWASTQGSADREEDARTTPAQARRQGERRRIWQQEKLDWPMDI